MTPEEEKVLVKRIKNGDSSGMSALYQACRGEFNRFVGRYIFKAYGKRISREDTEDLLQESMIGLYVGITKGNFDLDSAVKPYLYQIAKNIYEKQRIRDRLMMTYDLGLVNRSITTDKNEDAAYMLGLVRDCLKKLNEKDQAILEMVIFRQFSLESVMLRMGFDSISATKQAKYRAHKRLITLLDERLKNET